MKFEQNTILPNYSTTPSYNSVGIILSMFVLPLAEWKITNWILKQNYLIGKLLKF